jgi:hypothetical protein
MRPKTTGNVLFFQLIGDSFHGGSWLAAMSNPSSFLGMDPTPASHPRSISRRNSLEL